MYTKDEQRKHQIISTIPDRQVDLDGTNRHPVTIAYLESDTYDRITNGKTEKNVPKCSWTKVKKPSLKQRKKLVALALIKMIELTLSKHLYQLEEGFFKDQLQM